jgi:hypothetical protein
MRHVTILAAIPGFFSLRIIIPLCLASMCLSQWTAASVVTGSGGGKGTPIPGTNLMGTNVKLPYGPGLTGGHEPAIDPAKWGLCGLLGLSGTFDNSTLVRIVVQEGFYTVVTQYSNSHNLQPGYWPRYTWTCVDLTAFKNASPRSGWNVFEASPLTVGGGASQDVQIPGSGSSSRSTYVCIWAGVSGGLSYPQDSPITENSVEVSPAFATWYLYAQSVKASTLTTYAWCSGSTPPWSWTFQRGGASILGTGVNVPLLAGGYPPVFAEGPWTFINKANYWCYMMGIFTPGGHFTILPRFTSIGDYYEYISRGTNLLWDCLALTQ